MVGIILPSFIVPYEDEMIKFSVFVFVFCVAFSSCHNRLYVSNAVNVPLLKEKGEIKLNATVSDLQASVALTKHLALMGNGFYQGHEGRDNDKHNGAMAEIGVGYFTNPSRYMAFEMFGGVGVGRIYKQQLFNSYNESMLGDYTANAARAFIQPGIGFRSKFIDIAFSPRVSFLKYTSFNTHHYPADELKKDYLNDNRLTDPLFIFAEPAFTVRVGYKAVKLQAQYGLTLNTTSHVIRHAPDFGSIGIVIDLADWYKN